MRFLFVVCFLLGNLFFIVNGQQGTCATSCPFTGAATRTTVGANDNSYFIVGGLFDLHNRGATAYDCSSEMLETGFINLLAFFWGIDKYFNQLIATSSSSMKMAAIAFDSCMRADQSIENIFDYAQCRITIPNMDRSNLVAYIGPYTNDDAKRTGTLASDLGITLFSPLADSMDININDQKTLLKMTPSFSYDLSGIVAFLKSVNSNYVMVVYSGADPFWKAAYEELSRQITSQKATYSLCMQYIADADTQPMNNIVASLAGRTKAKYIVPLMSKERITELMTEIANSNIPAKNSFIFILNSRIGQDLTMLTQLSAVANNTIVLDWTLPLEYSNMVAQFNDYLSKLDQNYTAQALPDVNNPWIAEYMSKKTKSLPQLNLNMTPSPLVASVYRTLMSVNAVIQGMQNVIKDCGRTGNIQFCDQYRNLRNKNENLYKMLKDALNIHMVNSGDLKYDKVAYTYYVYVVSSTAAPKFDNVGSFEVDDTGTIVAKIEDMKNYSRYAYAFSEPECPTPNQGVCCEAPTTLAPATTAVMTASGGTASTQSTTRRYIEVRYPIGQAITGAYSDAARANSEYGTRFDQGHKWIIALGVLAGLGILCVIVFEIYILYKLLGTRLGNKWRTMWLGQLLLFGIFLCYLVLFAYLPTPTKATCGITRFGVGVSYAFCFAVLLVKLMVILTSKPSEVLLPGELETPNYLKGTYQFLMFIFAVGVQVVIDIQWLITVQPDAVLVTANNGERVWICNHYTWEAGDAMDNMPSFVRTEFENHLMSLIYIMVLILITTILSLNAHGIITNHRESIFVGIASGFSIPIWLAWGLVGGLNKNHAYAHEFGDACIAFGLFLTATLILFAMFLPKVRHLVNMGIEGIYLEDDHETVYGGSVILAPPSSYKGKGPGSVVFVNNSGLFSEPVVISNGDPMATHLKHPGSVFSAPGAYMKHPESMYGGSTRVLRVTDDLRGRHPQKRSQSEVAFGSSRRPRSQKGTLPRSRSQTNLGAL